MRRLNVANRKQALKVVKELDAFSKVPESYQETTISGGGISILTFVLILILIVSEFQYYTDSELQFDYQVDTNITGKVKINIDMTIAMHCGLIGADVLDQTGQDVQSYGQLEEEPTHFELSPKQKQYQTFMREMNGFLTEEYHAIQDLMWRSQYPNFRGGMPKREIEAVGPTDACRVHGSFDVNKVAGNFHVTAGKSVPVIPRGHAHIAIMMSDKDYNFSHRIDHFSFGNPVAGVVYPLDGEEQITNQHYFMYQYFMQVVPTEVRTYSTHEDTFQFSVTERNRTINHSKGSHGVPGIFVKYDLSSLKIRVREESKPLWQFLVRLCGIVGGVFSVSGYCHKATKYNQHVEERASRLITILTHVNEIGQRVPVPFIITGILHSLFRCLADVVCCKFKMGKYKTKSFDEASADLPQQEQLIPNDSFPSDPNPVSLLPQT